jgi:two-component system, NarL family, nitrate/nitrite response regulator NarL
MSSQSIPILRLLIQGTSNKLIGRQLVITEATVKVLIKSILRKLRLHNRTQAAMWASNHLGNGGEQINELIQDVQLSYASRKLRVKGKAQRSSDEPV